MEDTFADRSSPMLYHLPGGQISYHGKPMTSMNTAMQYPFNNISPEPRQLLGYTSPSESSPFHNRHVELQQARARLFPSPAQRSAMYSQNWDSALEALSDDEDSATTPIATRTPPSARVSSYIDEITNSPEMEQVEAETKKIRADAAAILLKLQTPTKLPSSKLYTTYDFSKLYKSPTRLEAQSTNEYYGLDEDEEHFRVRPKASKRYTPSYLGQPISKSVQGFNPYDFAAERAALDPVAKVAAGIEYKSRYLDECTKYGSDGGSKYINSYETMGAPSTSSYYNNYYTPRRPKYLFDSDSGSDVRNNIAIRAQYASNRAAANVGVRKFNEYLMP